MNDLRLNIDVQTKISQKLLITPRMKQSLSLLQMPITELAQEIFTYIEANPALEAVDHDFDLPDESDEPSETEGGIETESDMLDSLYTPEWDDYINEGNSNELSFTPLTYDDTDFEQFVSTEPSLTDHLMFQLKTAGLADIQIRIGMGIIGNLTDDGYFRASIAELAASCSVTEEDVQCVLNVVKTFDPAGIASGSLTECILAQLPQVGATEGEIEQIRELFAEYSAELAAYKYSEISKKTGLDRENLEELLLFVRRTDPRPGLNFGGHENRGIIPDVYIVRSDDHFEVLLNETGLPGVRLNNYYVKVLKGNKLDENAKTYIEDKIKNALWILKSLQKRQKAIYKVAKAIVDVQTEYLLKGEAYLKPLRLKDVADMTNLHESTVSRVTAGKYALSDQGITELKSFFSKGMDSDDGDVSTRKIKLMIRSVIDAEPIDKPYSDEKIVQLLGEQGIDVARRTIAKYRDDMDIPTMSLRKRMRR